MFSLSVLLIGIAIKSYACDVVCLENCTESKETCLMACGCDSEMKDLKGAFRENGAPMAFLRDSEETGIPEEPEEPISGCQISCTGMCMKYAQGWALAQCLEACGCDNDTILQAKGSGSNFLMAKSSTQYDSNLGSSNENTPLHISEEFGYSSPVQNNSVASPECILRCDQLCEQISAEECIGNCLLNFCIGNIQEFISYRLVLVVTVITLSIVVVIGGVKYVNSILRNTNKDSDFYKALD